jgi:hypothetical protein
LNGCTKYHSDYKTTDYKQDYSFHYLTLELSDASDGGAFREGLHWLFEDPSGKGLVWISPESSNSFMVYPRQQRKFDHQAGEWTEVRTNSKNLELRKSVSEERLHNVYGP